MKSLIVVATDEEYKLVIRHLEELGKGYKR